MATWKKVYVEGDLLPTGDGGTGLTALAQGSILVGGDPLVALPLADGTIVIGQGDSADPTAHVPSGDITMSDAGNFQLNENVVGAYELASDSTVWTTNEIDTATGVSLKPTIPFYKPNAGATVGEAAVSAAPTTDGQVLKYASSGNTLVWGSSAATDMGIVDQSTEDETTNNDYYLTFVSYSEAGDVDAFNVDTTTLTYNPGTNVLTNSNVVIDGDAANVTSVTNTAGGTITASNFVGEATEATTAKSTVTTGDTAAAHYLQMATGNTTGFKGLQFDTGIYYTPGDTSATGANAEGTLTVPNLTVTGNTTTIDTTELLVEDATITIAMNNLTDGGAETAGIYVDINDAAAANTPSLSYAGFGAADTPSGWKVARAIDNSASGTGVSTGIGTMEVSAVYVNSGDAGAGNSLSTGDTPATAPGVDIGQGAFCYSSAVGGGLFIQTA
jgi:hypothetical protein